MSANYLAPYLMNLAGLKLTGYEKYLLNLQQTLPVLTMVFCIDNNGTYYSNDDNPYEELIREYQILQYNNVADEKNRYEDFFYLQEGTK
jgi:hypothetical protein